MEFVYICTLTVWIAWLTALSSAVETTKSPDKLTDGQAILLQHAVKSMLGFEKLPSPMANPDPESGPEVAAAPRYMLRLYEEYQQGTYPLGRSLGNTVRSINAQIGMVNGEEMFVFNLTSIGPYEIILNSELHMYQKRATKRPDRPDVNLVLHQVAKSYVAGVESRFISGQSSGWQAFDVTSSVENCVLQRGQAEPYILAANFQRGSGRSVNIKRFMRHSYRPFLIVFSNDTQNITLDHIEPHFSPDQMRDIIIDPETGKNIGKLQTHKVRHDKSRENTDLFHVSTVGTPGESPTPSIQAEVFVTHSEVEDSHTAEMRRKRSIIDNEIPQDLADTIAPETPYNLPETQPHILHHPVVPRPDPTATPASRLIPYPDDYKARRRRRKQRRNRNQNKEGRLLPMPSSWQDELSEMEKEFKAVNGRNQACGLRRLVVDFADIGWSDWIISPRAFEANYCAGKCPFPLTKNMRPSNHATIQSLIHAIGIHTEVPAPCCVPDAMTSVTLLYFDESRNVVLKNYPNMSVMSCACR